MFGFRRVLGVPAGLQVALVAGLFVATVLLTHAGYRARGTTFGFAGPAFNVLVAPIYEELVLGWVTLRCRCVWPAVILHYANNLTYFLHAAS